MIRGNRSLLGKFVQGRKSPSYSFLRSKHGKWLAVAKDRGAEVRKNARVLNETAEFIQGNFELLKKRKRASTKSGVLVEFLDIPLAQRQGGDGVFKISFGQNAFFVKLYANEVGARTEVNAFAKVSHLFPTEFRGYSFKLIKPLAIYHGGKGVCFVLSDFYNNHKAHQLSTMRGASKERSTVLDFGDKLNREYGLIEIEPRNVFYDPKIKTFSLFDIKLPEIDI